MRFFLPRRHRRPLLFPPGLLALAGLLWLGCVALGRPGIDLKRRNVMQLTLPPRPVSDVVWRGFGPRLRYSQLARARNWCVVVYGEGQTMDSLANRQAKAFLHGLESETSPFNNGLCVRFQPRARYASLVLMLDLMSQYNVKRYLLDINRAPVTFYAFTSAPRPHRWRDPLRSPFPEPPGPGLGGVAPAAPVPSFWASLAVFDNWWPLFKNPVPKLAVVGFTRMALASNPVGIYGGIRYLAVTTLIKATHYTSARC